VAEGEEQPSSSDAAAKKQEEEEEEGHGASVQAEADEDEGEPVASEKNDELRVSEEHDVSEAAGEDSKKTAKGAESKAWVDFSWSDSLLGREARQRKSGSHVVQDEDHRHSLSGENDENSWDATCPSERNEKSEAACERSPT
jgi:hypothetical protein